MLYSVKPHNNLEDIGTITPILQMRETEAENVELA